MESNHKDEAARSDGALVVLLSEINSRLITIREILESNPLIAHATRSCDVRPYRDFTTEDRVYCFESCVDVTTHAGTAFNWSLDIWLTPQGWKFRRSVGEQTIDGEQPRIDFDDQIFGSFDDLAENYSALMGEFVESAKIFDFASK